MDNNAAPRKKRLHPEVAGILGILGILILIAFVMCAVNGRFEQWFGWTVFTGPKAYDSVVFAEIDGDSENLVVLNINKGTKETILTGAHISGIAVSRSGGKIAYVSPVDDIEQIFTIGPTGKKNKALTVGGNSKSKPGFSPTAHMSPIYPRASSTRPTSPAAPPETSSPPDSSSSCLSVSGARPWSARIIRGPKTATVCWQWSAGASIWTDSCW